MDVVLEVFDTFFFDRLYASVLPATPRVSAAAVSKFAGSVNASNPVLDQLASVYHYAPASQLFSLQPSGFAYMSSWARDNIYRQALSLFLITWYATHMKRALAVDFMANSSRLFGIFIYFAIATASYVFIFDEATTKHPRYLKNQIRMEIASTLQSLPVMAVFTVPFFLAEVRGYSKMYDTTAEGPGWWYDALQFPFFVAFTDFFIYWIHRGLHHKSIYKYVHKAHHKWVVPTPYASHAFHPMDGFAQSIPYHVFPFIFPLQKFAYIALFTFINIWTVMIHDGEYAHNSEIINGAACHTMHHL